LRIIHLMLSPTAWIAVRYPLGVLTLSAFSLFAVGSTLHRPAAVVPPTNTGDSMPAGVPVIVELFTSEGCSSCPPADALLAKLEERQPVANAQIIALEEHVDYWNNLGWMDPFSAKDWTARQEEYAGSLGNGNVYTPQMVINGQKEFVGSREQQARQEIAAAATGMPAVVSLTRRQPEEKGALEFAVSVGKLAGNKAGDTAEVWLAITEAGLHSNVTRGENAGEDLHHASVVRVLRKMGVADPGKEISFSSSVRLSRDPAWNLRNLHAVAFVQERRSRQIVGATVAPIDK
jgi:hypothetical protein